MSTAVQGACHCGHITWQLSLPPKLVLNCHCQMCRRLTGSGFSAWVIVSEDQLQITQGEAELQAYAATEHFSRHFCRHCGTDVYAMNEAKFPGCRYIARGQLPDDLALNTQVQVYTDSKALWTPLLDSVPCINP